MKTLMILSTVERGLEFWKLNFLLEDKVVRIVVVWKAFFCFVIFLYSSVQYLLGFPSDIFPILQGSLDRYSNWKYIFLNQSNSSIREIVIWFFKFILDVFEFAKLQNFVKWISKIVHSSRVILSILWKVAFSTIFSCWPAQHYIRRPGEHRH